jgi:DNA processing protein
MRPPGAHPDPLLRLSLVPGIGSARLSALIRHFGSADAVFRASPRQLSVFPGLGPELARRVAEYAGTTGADAAARAERALRRLDAVILTEDDPQYPDAFRALAEPAFLLFATGDLGLLSRPALAFVGTRSPTAYGREVTEDLAGGLARAGYAIVSGMARGIDTEAHTAALAAGGSTVGVLGHGIDSVYPPENRKLFERVRDRGLLLTEMPPGEKPRAGNFPRRNRLIAALSRAVVIVEMGVKSGAQHTVTYALEQGREIMAVPGPVGTVTSAGTNQLIRDGARMVTCVDDILEELEGVGTRSAERVRAASESPSLPLLSASEDRIVGTLTSHPTHVDALSSATGLPAGQLLGTLLDLEIRGFVESLPAKYFRRRRGG